jgi:PAS domain S-box-containing protein
MAGLANIVNLNEQEMAGGPLDTAELLRGVTQTSPECIKVVARDGRLLQMNPAGLDMIEAESWESVARTNVLDLVAPEHRARWLDHHARVCKGEHLAWEFDIIGLQGDRRSMQTRAAPITLTDGSMGQLAVTRDVTALARLQDSERSFELLVDSVTDYAIYMLDRNGRVVSWNSGARRIKGYEAGEIIGKHFECFYSPEDRAAGKPAAGLRKAALEGRAETEGWRIRKDGSRFFANVIIDAIRSNGELIGYAKITRDITQGRDAETRLRQAQKMEAVGQFTGGAAHDFNNLLMAILGSLEILRKRMPNDQRLLALLDNAVMGAKRGSSLTQRMLAFARRQELKKEAVDLASLVNNMRELLERSIGPAINIETHFPLEVVRARTDANQLETALLNLAINARDAMPDGGTLSISAALRRIEHDHPTNLSPGQYACLSVSDTGLGMDEATLARAPEPFFTTKGIGKGTGMGLSMVDGLVGQSGGKLIARSAPGRGTTIELWFPVATDGMKASQREVGGVDPLQGGMRQLSILLVDDDNLVLANVKEMLEDLGHSVIAVASGSRALEIFDSTAAIDLVVTDQAMPVMTGIQLIEQIRARRPTMPVILATGYAELPPGATATVGRLGKPFTQRALAEAVALSS